MKLPISTQHLRTALAVPLLCVSLHYHPAPALSMPQESATIIDHIMPDAANHEESIQAKEKTIYLIRHAESLENVAYQGARRVQASYAERSMPKPSDVKDAFALAFKMFRPAVMNAALSESGETQVRQLYQNLQRDRFVENLIQQQQQKESKQQPGGSRLLITHSPLVRAKQTAYGSLLGPEHLPPDDVVQANDFPGIQLKELPSLREVNPKEIIGDAINPWKKGKTIDGRIQQFEAWLDKQPEDTLIVVGHSVYFKRMLNLPETFNNCDVWEAKYGGSSNDPSGMNTAVETTKTMVEDMISGENSEMSTNLPRKWNSLKRLYRYTPELQVQEVDEADLPGLVERMSDMMKPQSSSDSTSSSSN